MQPRKPSGYSVAKKNNEINYATEEEQRGKRTKNVA
jgi:hypothetical protein